MSGNALVLDGVTRQFGALRAIEDITFTVAAGERRAILGANGAGKTTLFNAITGDFPPTHGSVHFFGEDVTHLPPHERIRRGLRRTYQSSLLFRELSVRDNLFLAVRGGTRGRFNMRRPRALGPERDRRPKHCCTRCASTPSATRRSHRCRTGSNGSLKSEWHWPARRD